MSKVIELRRVSTPSGQTWEIGQEFPEGIVTGIRLIADGKGPMGWYDRIHILINNVIYSVNPAHHMSSWNPV